MSKAKKSNTTSSSMSTSSSESRKRDRERSNSNQPSGSERSNKKARHENPPASNSTNSSDESESDEESGDEIHETETDDTSKIVSAMQASTKKDKPEKEEDEYAEIMKGAPHLLRVAALDLDLPKILAEGVVYDAAIKVGSTTDMSDQDIKTYRIVKRLLPGIVDVYKRLGNTKYRTLLLKKISEKANAGRSTDGNKGKTNLLKILRDIGNPPSDELPRDTGSKEDYGFRNDTTGRMLCPCTLDWDDSSVRQGLLDCSLPVTSLEHPLLSYKGCEYHEGDDEEGLFRNLAAIRLAKLIFTSPSSINEDASSKAATRSGNAKLAGLTSMTSRTIAYIHCMLRHLLSQRASYNSMDGKFNLYEYYWTVVNAIELGDDADEDDEDEETNFKDDLIKFWNSELFGSSEGLASSIVSRQPSEDGNNSKPNALNRLLSQRAQKKATKAARKAQKAASAAAAAASSTDS